MRDEIIRRLKKAAAIWTEKKVRRADLCCLAAAILCFSYAAGKVGTSQNPLEGEIHLESPWLVKTAEDGVSYIVDQEKSRILSIKNGQVEHVITGGASRGPSFGYAETISPGEEGALYVLDTGWSETGFSVDYEAIVKYSKDGTAEKICYRQDYAGGEVDKHRLFGLSEAEGFLYFVNADENGFSLNCLNPEAEDVREIFYREMKDAVTLVQDFAVDARNQKVYAVEKRGRILLADTGSDTAREIGRTQRGDPTVLYRAASGSGGTVYVTDLKNNRLLSCSTERKKGNGTFRTEAEGSQMWNVSYTDFGETGGLVAYVADGGVHSFWVNADGITAGAAEAETEQGELTGAAEAETEQRELTGAAEAETEQRKITGNIEGTVFPKSAAFRIAGLVYFGVLMAGTAAFLWVLARLTAVILTYPYTGTQKMGVLAMAAAVAVSLVLVSGLLRQFRSIYREELMTKLNMTAQIISDGIEERDLDAAALPDESADGQHISETGAVFLPFD